MDKSIPKCMWGGQKTAWVLKADVTQAWRTFLYSLTCLLASSLLICCVL